MPTLSHKTSRGKGLRALSLLLSLAWAAPSHAEQSKPEGRPLAADARGLPEEALFSLTGEDGTGFAGRDFDSASKIPGLSPDPAQTGPDATNSIKIARQYRKAGQYSQATAGYAAILENEAPEHLQQTAMLELAQMAQEQNNLPRAQQVLSQFASRWPNDPAIPEILLRQGLLYRQMGLFNLATSKFYAVMTSSLVLKPERFEYYQKLVRRAQYEVANTQFYAGEWTLALESLNRLLRSEPPPENSVSIRHRLILCYSALGRKAAVITQAQDFLERHSDARERAEVRFLLASSLQEVGRTGEAFDQVLMLLKEQRTNTTQNPAALGYWQRRAGNEIANRFYQQGDSAKALEVYLALAALDNAPEWQLPVCYQVGLVFERLGQPDKAVEYYTRIAGLGKGMGTNAGAGVKTVLEMASWRKDFLTWQVKAETTNLTFRATLMGTNKTDALPN